jgi:dUTP pyrophosphatase
MKKIIIVFVLGLFLDLENLKNIVESLSGIMSSEDLGDVLNDKSYELSIETKFVNKSNNPDPVYSKKGDSGFDLRAFISKPITIKPLERVLVPTGLKFELSPNTELQVRPRSGMALKYGISVLNTPGTVDEGYRGDVSIILVNISNEEYTVEPGERIAQGVIQHVVGQNISKLTKVESLSNTERGSSGFGSTGKK